MKRKYKIRTFESGERDGDTREGTIVLHIGGCLVAESKSIDELEAQLRNDLAAGKLAHGCVYQMVPAGYGSEPQRTLAIDTRGRARRCLLTKAEGFYSEFLRIRYPSACFADESLSEHAIAELQAA